MSRTRHFPLPDPPPEAPTLLTATYDTAEGDLILLFDQFLDPPAPGTWDAGTFTLYVDPSSFETDDVVQGHPAQITVRFASLGAYTGPPVCDYDDALGTLVGTNGLPVASWTGFPVSVI